MSKPRMTRPCRICPTYPCDPALHAATASLRAWLRARVTAYLEPVARGPKGHRTQASIQTVYRFPKLIP